MSDNDCVSVYTDVLEIQSHGMFHSENITNRIEELVAGSGIKGGVVTLLLTHTTAALMLMEHEAGILADIQDLYEWIINRKDRFHHHLRMVDENGPAHVLSSMLNTSLSLPLVDGRVPFGEFQDVVFMDFEYRKRTARILVHVFGS